jgi:anti-sigma B factor antagonist
MTFKSEQIGPVAVVDLDFKRLDAAAAPAFKRDVASVLDRHKLVLFDLSRIEYVDSAGLGALISCLRRVTAQGGDLKLCGLHPKVRVLFELVRMHRMFEILNDRREALASF